jgi:hypothetical protein
MASLNISEMTQEQKDFLLNLDICGTCVTCGGRIELEDMIKTHDKHGVERKFCSSKCFRQSESAKQKMSIAHTGKTLTENHKQHISESGMGKVISIEQRLKISASHKGMKKPWAKPPIKRGEEHWNWKGGIERHRPKEVIKWRHSVLTRDEFTCQICGFKHIHVEAHHLNSYANQPNLRLNIDNGVTLCRGCHKELHHEQRKGGVSSL